MKAYGKELIIDLHECTFKRSTKKYLNIFFKDLVKIIDMDAQKVSFWEYDDEQEYQDAPLHLKGISGVQFISTSDIMIHALDEMKCVYINIFSCKDFVIQKALDFSVEYFGGKIVNYHVIDRI